jgi:dienelactone hydrolase
MHGAPTTEVTLASGALLRRSAPLEQLRGHLMVLGLGGSVARPAAPRWSASMTWLLQRLMRDDPGFAYAELRYRNRSWRAVGDCVRDAREALAVLPGGAPIVPIGFSMGGGIAIAVAGDRRVPGVIGLAPWVPEGIDLGGLRGKRLAIVHGSRDRYLPLLPGVPPEHSRRVMERATAAGARTSHLLIGGAIHAIAVRTPVGLLPLPHAKAWARAVQTELRELAGDLATGGHERGRNAVLGAL